MPTVRFGIGAIEAHQPGSVGSSERTTEPVWQVGAVDFPVVALSFPARPGGVKDGRSGGLPCIRYPELALFGCRFQNVASRSRVEFRRFEGDAPALPSPCSGNRWMLGLPHWVHRNTLNTGRGAPEFSCAAVSLSWSECQKTSICTSFSIRTSGFPSSD